MPDDVRLEQELKKFTNQEVVHSLPSTYDYWSSNYLRPRLRSTGHANFHEMFIAHVVQAAKACPGPLKIVSVGAGNGDFEVMLAGKMAAAGVSEFLFECLDINEVMLERGRRHASEAGFGGRFAFLNRDFNTWTPDHQYHIVIANQSLHHVTELEHLFGQIHSALHPKGYFLISDMIGRNGHMRWPEVEDYVQRLWATLPDEKKFHNQLKRTFETFYNHDCSKVGFEGIRAQDILPLLIEQFSFAYFIGFAAMVTPFIGRGYGPNFDIRKPEDKRFIDDVAIFDQALIDAGILKPTQMFAALTRDTLSAPVYDRHLTPEFCVRIP